MAEPSQATTSRRSAVVTALLSVLGIAALGWLFLRPPSEGGGADVRPGTWSVEKDRAVVRGETMGTTWSLVVAGPPEASDRETYRTVTEQALAAVDAAMSTYRAESELSRFNATAANEAFAVSSELAEVVAFSLEVARETDGAFDPTVGPLVDAWGFGPADERAEEPDVEALRAVVGYDKIVLDAAAGTLTKRVGGVRLDLSAVAKGYAVDRVHDALRERGATQFMIEVGGEVRVSGLAQSGRPWQIGIERPSSTAVDMPTLHRAIPLADGAGMATSGDYRNYREIQGRRVSHTINPRTGRPIAHALASVSVVAERAMDADAWATALNVMGPSSLTFAERRNLATLMLVREGEGFSERMSPAFATLLQQGPK